MRISVRTEATTASEDDPFGGLAAGRPIASEPPTFEEFFLGEYESIARGLFLITGNKPDAEDAVQEAMARTLERWDRVGKMASPSGYTYTTAVNLVRRTMRRRSLQARLLESLADTRTASDPSSVSEIRDVLQGLPIRQREALVLVDWMGFSTEDAAQALGIQVSALRTRLHRGRRSLRSSLGGGNDDES